MAENIESLVTDCSVVVRWKLTDEDYLAQAQQLLLDWQKQAIAACAPNLLQSEVMSAFLRACRHGRISETEAVRAVDDLLRLPFQFFDVTPVLQRAFEIAQRYNQRSYDSIYVALAEQKSLELWTGDRRLYNAVHTHLPFVRWIGNYQQKRGE